MYRRDNNRRSMNKGGNMIEDEQQLFLIEFLVDQVNVPTVRAIQEDILPSTTCVTFQILNLPPINIYQDDPLSLCACPEDTDTAIASSKNEQTFRKGKSCLFALPTIALEKPLNSFPVTMSVYKKLPPGVLPDVMLIGSCQIEVKDLINSIVKDYVFMRGKPSRNIKDTFRIKTATGQPVGRVIAFLRVSCFGKKIVTQFQIPHNQKPYLFKGDDNSPIIQCQKIDNNKNDVARTPVPTDINATKCQQRMSPNDSYLHMHPDIYSSAMSENRTGFIIGESPINLKKCACCRKHT